MAADTAPRKVVVLGATGNVGTAVLRALTGEPGVGEIVGVARRRPEVEQPKVTWATADIAVDALDHDAGGRLRLGELRSGVGARA